jgi:hypothetical protein
VAQQHSTSWFVVRRTYRVEDFVYVEAADEREAIAKAREGDYEDVSEAEPISSMQIVSSDVRADRSRTSPHWGDE